MNNINIAMIIISCAFVAVAFSLVLESRRAWRDKGYAMLGINYAILALVLGVILGRLYYFLIDVNNVDANFFVTNMQFGSFGVLAGCIIAAFIISIVYRVSFARLLDISVTPLLLLVIFTRVSDFFIGTNFGRAVEEGGIMKFPFAVFMPVGRGGMWLSAVFFYEFVFCMLLLIAAMFLRRNNGKGFNFAYFIGLYCAGRIVFESMRQDSLYIGFVKISQIVSAVGVVAVIIVLLVFGALKKNIKLPMIIAIPVVMVAAVGITVYCEFAMGTEIAALCTSVMAACMAVLGIILTYEYIKLFKKSVDISSK